MIACLLELSLKEAGHHAVTAPDAATALDLVADRLRPDLILADYNLPNGLTGLELAATLLDRLGREIPVIILTGDISAGTLRSVALQNCVQLTKPVKLTELSKVIQRLLQTPQSAVRPRDPHPAARRMNSCAPRVMTLRRNP